MENLRVHFRQRVLTDWPLTLEQWDKLPVRDLDAPPSLPALTAVQVAQECNVPEILRPALYHLARSTFGYSDHHRRRRNHELVMENLGLLSREASTCVILGHRKLREDLGFFLTQSRHHMISNPGSLCENCKRKQTLMIATVDEFLDDPLLALRELAGEGGRKYIELDCSYEAVSCPIFPDASAERQRMWNSLPYCFDINWLLGLP